MSRTSRITLAVVAPFAAVCLCAGAATAADAPAPGAAVLSVDGTGVTTYLHYAIARPNPTVASGSSGYLQGEDYDGNTPVYDGVCWAEGQFINNHGVAHNKWVYVSNVSGHIDGRGPAWVWGGDLAGNQTGGVPNHC